MEYKNEITLYGVLTDIRHFEKENWSRIEFNIEMPKPKNKKERIPCVAWNEIGNEIETKCNDGEPIEIKGEIHNDTWKDANGKWNSRTYINASKLLGCYADNKEVAESKDKYEDVDFNIENISEDAPF